MSRLHFPLILAALGGPACAQTPVSLNLLFDGDSISAGWGAPQGQGLESQTAAAIGSSIELRNVSRGGRPVWQCLQLYPSLVKPAFDPSKTDNIIAFHGGDNDIAQGHDAQHTYAAFGAYVSAAHHQGWKVVVTTELRRFTFNEDLQRELNDYNQMLIANAAHADAVIDLNSDARLGERSYRSDLSLFNSDGVHPTAQGYAIIAGMLAPAIRRLWSNSHQD